MLLKTHTEVITTPASPYPVAKVVHTFDIDDKPPMGNGMITVEHLTGRCVKVEYFEVPMVWQGDYA